MSTPTFVDTHNLVVFLENPIESVGFEEIVDFLNARHIKYALTVNPTIYTSCIQQLWATAEAKTVNDELHIQALVDKKVIITEKSVRSDLHLEDAEGCDCLPNATIFEELERMGEGKGFSGNITPLFATMMVQAPEEVGEGSNIPTDPHHTPTTTQPSISKPQKKQSRRKQRKDTEVSEPSGPTEPGADETENVKSVPTHSNDPLLSGEDRLKLTELMELCTTLQARVLALETTKTNQALEIDSLKRRVKKLEKKASKRTHKLKRMYKVGLITLVDETLERYDADEDMLGVHDLGGEEVVVEHVDTSGGKKVEQSEQVVEKEVSTGDQVTTASEVFTTASVEVTTANATTTTVDELTLAQTLMEIKAAKPKAVTTVVIKVTPASTRPRAKGIAFHDQEEKTPASTPIVSSLQPLQLPQAKDKAEEEEEERIAREKVQEANIAWDDIQGKVETDYELAQRLQPEEQEKLSIEEKAIIFQELLEKRRKFFAAKIAEEKRNKPPTKAQQRSYMSTYLKNMAGWRAKDLKNKSFAEVQKLFDKEMKRVNIFVDMDRELVKGSKAIESEVDKAVPKLAAKSSKRASEEELDQEVAKKQKIDVDQEEAEMK
ncbi:hypothetical protein Tco_1199662 [Tanacetum coccineum]